MKKQNTIRLTDEYYKKNLFIHVCEENTIKKTLEDAVKKNIELSIVEFKNQDLSYSNLRDAKLFDCEFIDSDICFSDFTNSKLYCCSFIGVSFKGCILDGVGVGENTIISRLSYETIEDKYKEIFKKCTIL